MVVVDGKVAFAFVEVDPIGGGQTVQKLPRPVGAQVVDDEHFVGDASKRLLQGFQTAAREIEPVVHRDDDAHFGSSKGGGQGGLGHEAQYPQATALAAIRKNVEGECLPKRIGGCHRPIRPFNPKPCTPLSTVMPV